MTSDLEEPCDVDWGAVEQRLAFLLYQMATKIIGERIKVDALAADNAIHYCRERASGAPYNPARQEHFLEFILRCGGSMEWIMDGDIAPLIVAYASASPCPRWAPYRASLYEVE